MAPTCTPGSRARLEDRETLALEPVRFELMRRFGYFVTQSSGHASEYLPYFRKRPDLLASLVETFESAGADYSAWFGYGHTGGDVAARRTRRAAYEQEVARQIAGTEPSNYSVRTSTALLSSMPSRLALFFASTATCPMTTSSLTCPPERAEVDPGVVEV